VESIFDQDGEKERGEKRAPLGGTKQLVSVLHAYPYCYYYYYYYY
jgi:hypothetical protein